MKWFWSVLAFLSLSMPLNSSAQYVTPHAPLLGSAWYPEQWPEVRWDADLTLMEEAHFDVVRIGEFAWSTLEPSEGHYDLDWMQRAVEMANRHHIAVVIGTPTDAPPAWLTAKYPDTLGVNADGRRREHGGRRQFNYANPLYREFCRKIVGVLAERFGHNSNVIGWQIGNEYTDESFDKETRTQFQKFLQRRYGSLASLNGHWATAYWSQRYTDWSQIPFETTYGNPGLLLEHRHFVTATWRSFQKNQVDELRKHIVPSQFITTNTGGLGWSDNWDHYAVNADLDLASWDDYVGQGHLQDVRNAMLNDFARGWRSQNFWVMETQPGSVNWAPVNNALFPGETRALAWQTVGHGADAVLYWQWRSALNGQEEYHGAIVGPDGSPLPLFGELSQLGEEFAKVSAVLAGTSPSSEIGVLHTYDSRWAIDFQPQTQRYDQQKVMLQFYGPLEEYAQRSGHAIDIIDPTSGASLSGYKFLVAPSLNVLSARLANSLLGWVRSGGHLLLGPRSGMKDEYNSLNPQRQPGPLVDALGARVEQYYALDAPVKLGVAEGTADVWAEDLNVRSPDVRVDLRFGTTDGGWLDGRPAMVTRKVGAGSISYLGTLPDEATMKGILDAAARDAHVSAPIYDIPKGVEVCARRSSAGGDGRAVYVLINHTGTTQHLRLAGRFQSVIEADAVQIGEDGVDVKLTSQAVVVLAQGVEHGR